MKWIKDNIIIILLIAITILSVSLYKLNKEVQFTSVKNLKYHFYFIGQNSVDPFWNEIKKGAEDAAKDYNVAVEFKFPKFTNKQEELQYLDIATTSNVDGIVTHGYNDEEFTNLINTAYSKEIPVVTIDNDSENSDRKSFIGANSYMLGLEAGKLMARATGGKANIAIIINNDYDSTSHNLKINGFLSAIKGYPDIKLENVYSSKMGILSAEEITQSIITDNKNIDAIYTTTSVDTLGSAQLIVDFNKAGDIKLIGYGDTDEILRYIDKNIVYGTVVSDGYKMGYESIKALSEIKENKVVSSKIDTGLKVITKDNLYRINDNKKRHQIEG